MKRNGDLSNEGRGTRASSDAPDAVDLLGVLDPGFDDSSYWRRFRLRVLSRASSELGRRHLQHATVPEVVQSWTRALVPIAAIAAAIAGLMVLQDRTVDFTGPVGIEEVLISELEEPALPNLVGDESGNVTFAADVTF